MKDKPILCLDFDGVLHSYTSGWVKSDFIPDPPVPGAFAFLAEAVQHFQVRIYSARSSHQDPGDLGDGIRAMRLWIEYWAQRELPNEPPTYLANLVINQIAWNNDAWPERKPPAFLTIDDRALTFNGTWPSLEELRAFKPWNKR
jgi:hypothetical protein